MRLIKKSEQLIINKIKSMESEEENLQTEMNNAPETLAEETTAINVDNQQPNYNYNPGRDNPIVHSVGNTGWQVSEIWKEIRLDDFCNGW
ncbi:hypothetical protein A0J48_012180 [Sphaerospermopsis aphanizomenoides BCCUSP55]|uniref:hypothetical protein n=1 Tax=Sphaerospermopsis aphanizomenoides TaxID=459663 RepID=UPI000A5D05A4|nr:hypothetical protein [Sphaerospermopsis aphanizomenoides]MBK1988286.1 hypothetical protein [Sphaerospermopsis aphanizomenoides BCCUSP55]